MTPLYHNHIITMYVTKGLLLFGLILFIPVNIFSVMLGEVFQV